MVFNGVNRMTLFKCIRFKNPIVKCIMFLAWPTQSIQLFKLRVEAVRVGQNTSGMVRYNEYCYRESK